MVDVDGHSVLELILISIVTASISFTITESKLFELFRNFIRRKNSFFGELVSCGYCLGHWVAFAIVIMYDFNVFNNILFIDYFFTGLIIAWLSAIQLLFMYLLMNKAGK